MNTASIHSIEWCDYDQIWKITWKINGRLTNNFSSRGKRIGQEVTFHQRANEYSEAASRAQTVVDYLTKKISRADAIEQIEELDFLCPKDVKSHLLTMSEFAANLR